MIDLWDIHNHILPGIDDGASCLEETFDMLQQEYDQGVRHIVFTPHLRKGMFEISPEERIRIFEQVNAVYDRKFREHCPGMEMMLGCELHMHPSKEIPFAESIYQMPGSRIVLTEFSGRDTYEIISEILQPLLDEGYRCVIAHVERYRLTAADVAKLRAKEGVYIQCNAGSILGREGFRARMASRKLLAEELVDLIGSDAHDTSQRTVCIGECSEWIRRKYGVRRTKTIMRDNPERLFGEQ